MVAAFAPVGHVGQVGGHRLVSSRQGLSIVQIAEAQKIAPAGSVGADRRLGLAPARVGVRAFGGVGQLRQGVRRAVSVAWAVSSRESG